MAWLVGYTTVQDKEIHLLFHFRKKKEKNEGVWGWRHRGEAIKIILAVWRCQKDRQGADRHTLMLPDPDKEPRKKNAGSDNKYKREDRREGEKETRKKERHWRTWGEKGGLTHTISHTQRVGVLVEVCRGALLYSPVQDSGVLTQQSSSVPHYTESESEAETRDEGWRESPHGGSHWHQICTCVEKRSIKAANICWEQ